MSLKWVISLGLSLCLIAVVSAADSTVGDFYVAVNGSDGNPGTQDKPFATVDKARQAVREKIAQGLKQPVTVLLRGGVYTLSEPLIFGSEDSGTKDCPIIYAAYLGENPTLSGGRAINGWSKDDKDRWTAHTDLGNFRQLYVNGRRAIRAQGPVPGGWDLLGMKGYRVPSVEMAQWPDAAELELCYDIEWTHTRCKVREIQADGDHAVIKMQQPWFGLARRKEGVHVELPKTMENALALLDEPGEWYLHRATGTVHYLPRPGEDITAAKVVAPALEKLVEIKGTPDHLAHDIYFSGITFADATWLSPSDIGLVDLQANFILNPASILERDGVVTNVHNECDKSPANIVCHAAVNIRFENCEFTRLGGAGVDIESGCRDVQINGCRFQDIASSAIQIGDVLEQDHHPRKPNLINVNNQVRNCLIENCAVDYMGGIGIFVGYTEGTILSHNEIRNLPYSGISFGWGWGEEDAGGGDPLYYQPERYTTPTTAKNNRIEFNHIHHVMQRLRDGGGVYALGNQPGSIVRGNYIHDVPKAHGIYFDEGSGYIEVVGNFVEKVDTAMNFNNRKQNRIATCPLKDNFFANEDKTFERTPENNTKIDEIIRNAGIQKP
jgi:hypothetical protein